MGTLSSTFSCPFYSPLLLWAMEEKLWEKLELLTVDKFN
jgi:hypothetical protein